MLHPTVLIGIDGATFHVLDALMAEGHMPNLQAFLEQGVRADLMSTAHPLTPPAWTTLMTGKGPGNHGVFDFIWAEERGDQAYFTLNNFRDIRAETIWTIVSRQGGSVTSLNYPFMSPPPVVNGVVVPGLVSWKHLRRNCYPKEVYAELQQLPGFDVKGVAWDFDREKRATKVIPKEEQEEWVTFHIKREAHWFDIFRHLVRTRPTDLTAILHDGVDKLQHICWTSLDPDLLPENPTPEEAHMRRLCVQYFEQLDAFIGEVMAMPEARVFLASDHGFGPTEKVFRLNKWLEQKGYLSFGKKDHLDENGKAKVDKMATNHFVHVDWENTIAYAPSASTNGIHIRVQREPGQSGIPEEEYFGFRERLIEELMEVKDPDTGEPFVREVLRLEDAFPGEHADRGPDLTVILRDYGFVSTLDKEPIIWTRPEVAGTHNPAGIFAAKGPGIRAGVKLDPQPIIDVPSTLLYSLGLPVPSDFEGFVIKDAFEPEFLDSHAIQIGEATLAAGSAATEGQEADAEEEQVILDRLRALGYVE